MTQSNQSQLAEIKAQILSLTPEQQRKALLAWAAILANKK